MGNQKTATIQWAGQNLNFTGAGGSGFSLRFGGKSGPETASPMELVALASGACTAMDTIDILRKKRQEVTGFEINVVGLRASEHPMVFTEVDLEYVVLWHNIDPKAVERSIAQPKRQKSAWRRLCESVRVHSSSGKKGK